MPGGHFASAILSLVFSRSFACEPGYQRILLRWLKLQPSMIRRALLRVSACVKQDAAHLGDPGVSSRQITLCGVSSLSAGVVYGAVGQPINRTAWVSHHVLCILMF